jgi:hypothetical protein
MLLRRRRGLTWVVRRWRPPRACNHRAASWRLGLGLPVAEPPRFLLADTLLRDIITDKRSTQPLYKMPILIAVHDRFSLNQSSSEAGWNGVGADGNLF